MWTISKKLKQNKATRTRCMSTNKKTLLKLQTHIACFVSQRVMYYLPILHFIMYSPTVKRVPMRIWIWKEVLLFILFNFSQRCSEPWMILSVVIKIICCLCSQSGEAVMASWARQEVETEIRNSISWNLSPCSHRVVMTLTDSVPYTPLVCPHWLILSVH